MDQELQSITFGVEIECLYPVGWSRARLAESIATVVDAQAEVYNHTTRPHWKVVSDGSIGSSRGCEVVSPILAGQEGLDVLAKVCEHLDSIGCIVDRDCGLHVHVGVTADVDLFKRLLVTYRRYERVIDAVMAPSRRGDNNAYCRSLPPSRTVKRSKNLRELRRVAGLGRRPDRWRFSKLNVEAYWRHGTVEFRQHQGSVNAEKITNWTLFCLRFVHAARSVDRIRVLVAQNPRRAATDAYRKFSLYRDGMTLAEAYAAGLNRADVRYDLARGHIAIEGSAQYDRDLNGLLDALKASAEEREYFTRRAALFAYRLEGSET